MSKKGDPVYSREFKLGAVRRMVAGANVSALFREPQVERKRLYAWRDSFRAGRRLNSCRRSLISPPPGTSCSR